MFNVRLFLLLLVAGAIAAPAPAADPAALQFEMHRLGTAKYEACGVADFNNDGKLDIVSGAYLYPAPAFKPVKIREIKGSVDAKGDGYFYDFMNEPLDVDGDGKIDLVALDFFQKSVWCYQNPGPGKDAPWAETLLVKSGNYETGNLVDVDGDGKAREVLPQLRPTVWYEMAKGADGKITAAVHEVSKREMDYGAGAGDLNGDGRPDIIRPEAWYEAPADPRQGQWKEHPLELTVPQKDPKTAKHISTVLVHDVNGDGLNDIVYTMAHGYGIFWMEQARQGGEITFKRHLIDDTWSQAHTITLADLDGDGVKELVTGKRFRAHNGHDPEEDAPLGVYYYKPEGKGAGVKWTKHPITFGQGIGAGLNIAAVDLDGDGDLDLVTTGKWGGPVWFENKLK
jgi:hypothetical protein